MSRLDSCAHVYPSSVSAESSSLFVWDRCTFQLFIRPSLDLRVWGGYLNRCKIGTCQYTVVVCTDLSESEDVGWLFTQLYYTHTQRYCSSLHRPWRSEGMGGYFHRCTISTCQDTVVVCADLSGSDGVDLYMSLKASRRISANIALENDGVRTQSCFSPFLFTSRGSDKSPVSIAQVIIPAWNGYIISLDLFGS